MLYIKTTSVMISILSVFLKAVGCILKLLQFFC